MASSALQPILAALRVTEPREVSLEERRLGYEGMARLCRPAPDVSVEPVSAGGVDAEWLSVPESDAGRLVVYFHGGGYVSGSLDTHRDLASRLAREIGGRALNVAYRLAPEHPFPAALEDALAAYRWLVQTGVDPRQVALAGDSAGGGLAVSVLVAARDAGDPLPAAAVAMSPWTDFEASGETMTSRARVDPMISREQVLATVELVVGDGDRRHPLIAPIYADLRGLPPILIQVGDAETMLDDSRRLAERARAAGVEVELEVWDEMFHGWQMFARLLPEGARAIERIGAFLRRRLG